jgi:hypothetical protein
MILTAIKTASMLNSRLSLFLLLLLPLLSFSQTITPQVIATAGDFAIGQGFTLAWTVGEVAVASYETPSIRLTEGFHQPDVYVTSIRDELNLGVLVYPNPARHSFTLQKGELNPQSLHQLQIIDVMGKIVFEQSLQQDKTKEEIYLFESLSAGTYFIQIRNKDGLRLVTAKIQFL